jgi:hypothetical protein
MAVERRGNNLYYYAKRREGERVVSEYVGKGETVDFWSYIAESRKQERRLIQQAHRIDANLEAEINQYCRAVDLMVKAELISMGYHQHKGQWRRRRES